MAQVVERLTLDFGSGRDLTGSSPVSGSALTVQSMLGILSLSLSLCSSLAHALSLSLFKLIC